MDDLIAFLKARLDEREAKARAAGEIGTLDWHVGDDGSGDPESDACVVDGNGEIVVYDEGRPRLVEAEHIADNDPAWALADVESKRKILDDCAYVTGSGYEDSWGQGVSALEMAQDTVKNLALPYAKYPGYREEWKP